MTRDKDLGESLRMAAPLGIIVDHRLITRGDEHALLPEESSAFQRSAVEVRRASGAARIVARALIDQLGRKMAPLPKSPAGPPIWPKGILGSLAHDSRVAVAAVGSPEKLTGVGIDVEPATALPSELLDLVTTPRERAMINCDPYRGRLFFVAKEAVYKAVFPLNRRFLDYHEVEVDIPSGKAIVRNGRSVDVRFSMSTHVVALAFF